MKDEELEETLELTSRLLSARDKLSESVSSGHLKLAQARFILGPGSVSSLQYNLNGMTGHQRVSVCDEDGDISLFEYNAPVTKENNCEEEGEEKAKKAVNPLQWFAFLPPEALRQAQQHFSDGSLSLLLEFVDDLALSDLVQVAMEQHRLMRLLNDNDGDEAAR